MSEQVHDDAPQACSPSETDRLGAILESFLDQYRLGERPSVTEVVCRHPELADDVRELLSALIEMEQLGSHSGDAGLEPGNVRSRANIVERALGRSAGHVPERLGDYRILRRLGSGGMGVVYEAVRESLKSRVALKVMHTRFRDDRTYVRRFHTEASSAARLHHSNIVSVFDYGKQDGVCYYAMQYIAGHGLDHILDDVRRLRTGRPHRASAETFGPEKPSGGTDTAGEGGDITGASGQRANDPSPRPITLALLSGKYAADCGIAATLAERVEGLTVTAGLSPTRDARAPDSPSVEFECAPIGAPSRPEPAAHRARPLSSSAGGASSGSLSEKSEDHYFREVARLATQAADALAYSHRRGVLHRDIKPSNLMVDATGTLWITDFGLAKFEGGEDLSRSQDLVGTLRYMAPERFRSTSDRRSDIYSLGATLYEMLTLQPVFDAKDQLQLIDRIKNDPPVPPRQHDRRIPRDLETIVLKALAKDPADRFATADEMAEELRRYHQYRPINSRPVPWNERLWRWSRRNPKLAIANSLAMCLLAIIVVISIWAAWAARHNARLSAELESKNAIANRNLLQANRNLVLAYGARAEAFLRSRRVGQRFETLGEVDRAMKLASAAQITDDERFRLRNVAIGALSLPDLRVAQELDLPRAKENGVAFDRAYQRYATKLDDGTVVIRSLADGRELLRLKGLPCTYLHTTAQFSPDGRFLGITAGKLESLEVWDTTTQRQVVFEQSIAWANRQSWSFRPDSGELALVRKDGVIAIYELPSGRPLKPLTAPKEADLVVAYSADGSKLAYKAHPGHVVKVIDRDTGREVAQLANPSGVHHIVWNPRRPNIVATACDRGPICLWNVESKQSLTLKGEQYGGMTLAFHPSGELLASRGWQDVLRLWDTRGGVLLLSQPSSWCSTLEFDASGRHLGIDLVEGKARVFEVASLIECRVMASEPPYTGEYGPIAIDPTGQRLVSGGDHVSVWDLPSGDLRATIPVNRESHGILFDASGAIITQAPATLRWPISESEGGQATIGPPELVHRRGFFDAISMSADGGTLVQSAYDRGGLFFDAQHPMRRLWLRPHPQVRGVAITADSRWVVTGSHVASEGLRLWDGSTGQLIHEFPGIPKSAGNPRFSPDGRWLAIHWGGWVLLDTRSWKIDKRLSTGPTSSLAFAPDSRTAVFDNNGGMMTLVDPATGRELARLEDPLGAKTGALAFTPDGARVVTTLSGHPFFRIWDLATIRRELRTRGLDWTDAPLIDSLNPDSTAPIAAAPYKLDLGKLDHWNKQALNPFDEPRWPKGEAAVSLYTADINDNPEDTEGRILRGRALLNLGRHREAADDFAAALSKCQSDVELFTMAGNTLAQLGRHREAIAALDRALDLLPNDASLLTTRSGCYRDLGDYARAADDLVRVVKLGAKRPDEFNELAWALVAGPADARDVKRGLELARAAAAATPSNARTVNTLGVALYRDGNLAGSIKTLEANRKAWPPPLRAFDEVFLAMAYEKLGRRQEARSMLRSTRQSLATLTEARAEEANELHQFLAEAEAICLDPSFPADPFARTRP
jgi:serine/threonine protein kinase/WD40 repeat protein/tetratricopeptide (TPR) repeat protein